MVYHILLTKDLPKENYQFELAYIVLQTEKMRVDDNKIFAFMDFSEKIIKLQLKLLNMKRMLLLSI